MELCRQHGHQRADPHRWKKASAISARPRSMKTWRRRFPRWVSCDIHRRRCLPLMTNRGRIRKLDYEALAAFRYALRRFLRFSEEGARAAGLTPQQHQLLLAVKGHPGREWVSITELAEALQIRHHAAVGLVDRCEGARLIHRTPDPRDRRQVRVLLTVKGDGILGRLSTRNRRELRTLRQALRLPLLSQRARGDSSGSKSKPTDASGGRGGPRSRSPLQSPRT